MDETHRQITKIARTVNQFTVQTMKEDGIGTAEFDFIHLVRHHPGITQAKIREALKIDKGAAARRTTSLENKGYLIRKENPEDKRSQLLYATPKAEQLKNSKTSLEASFYEFLLEDIANDQKEIFLEVLNEIYLKSKKQRHEDFLDVASRIRSVQDEKAK